MKTAKRIGIYFSAPGFDDAPFHKPEYRQAYHDLAKMITDRGAKCFIVRDEKTFLGAGRFSKSWLYRDGAFVSAGEVQLDVVYNKGETFQADEATPMINEPGLNFLSRNKDRAQKHFPDLHPRSVHVNSEADVRKACADLGGDRLVAKPTGSWGGDGVVVGMPANIADTFRTFPGLIQEFIDTSHGIPGIIDGTHDFRLVMIGGELAMAYVRTPPEGKLVANLAQGGTIIPVALNRVPDGALAIAKTVDADFERFGRRAYSVDMGLHSDGRWLLFEINSQPGLTSLKWGPESMRYYELLVGELLK